MVCQNGRQSLAGGFNVLLPVQLHDRLQQNTLSEEDIESYLQEAFESPFEDLLKHVIKLSPC